MRIATRSSLRLLLLALVVTSLLAGTAGCTEGGKTEVTIFTGGTAGVYFPLGSKYAVMSKTRGTGMLSPTVLRTWETTVMSSSYATLDICSIRSSRSALRCLAQSGSYSSR